MKLTPLGARVVVRKIAPAVQTKNGILIPESARDSWTPPKFEVLAIGPDAKIAVKVGDRVVLSSAVGATGIHAMSEYLAIVDEAAVIGVADESAVQLATASEALGESRVSH